MSSPDFTDPLVNPAGAQVEYCRHGHFAGEPTQAELERFFLLDKAGWW
ncbi:hypothetical protein [Nonomuraea sp. NPDC049784]